MSPLFQYLLGAVLAFFLGMVISPWLFWPAGVFALAFIGAFLSDLRRLL